jgi:ATP-dependent helicase/DNAse subunit B
LIGEITKRVGCGLKTTAISGELREHHAIIARLREAFDQGDFTMMVVFPTRSLLREIEEELLHQPGAKGIGGIRFLLFEGFIGEVTERLGLKRRKPSELQQQLLIAKAFQILNHSGRLSYLNRAPFTVKYRQALLDGIAEWKRAGLTTELMVNWATEQGEKEQQLAKLYLTYQHLLAANGFVEEDELLEQLRQIRSQTEPVARRPQVVLYGYTDLTRQQADFIDVLTLWFDFEAVLDPTNAPDLQELIRQHFNFKKPVTSAPESAAPTALNRLRQSLWQSEATVINLEETDFSLQLLRADGRSRQATALAREIATLLRSGSGYELADFLILSPQPQVFLKTAQPIFAEYQLPLAQPTRPVKEFPAALQFWQALQTVVNGWQWPDLEGLIRQFYAGTDSSSRDKLLLSLGKSCGALSGQERWLELLADPQFAMNMKEQGIALEPLQQCLKFLATFPETAPGVQYLQLARDWFELAGAQTLRYLPSDATLFQMQLLNYQAANQLQQACEEFLRNFDYLADLTEAITLGEFGQFFEDYLLQSEVTPINSPQNQIRVIPPCEARGLRAKVVFITGLEQGVFPRNYINDWKLSPTSRFELKALGVELETGEQYQQQEKLAFYWALQTAGDRLYLVARVQDDAGQLLNRSPFLTAIMQLLPDLPGRSRYYSLEPRVQPSFGQCYAPAEEQRRWVDYLLQDPAAIPETERQICDYLFSIPQYRQLALRVAQWLDRPALTADQSFSTHPQVVAILKEQFGAEHSFSITALDEYRNCPYSFFLKRLLRIKPLVEPSLQPEVIDLGNLYHQILREFGEQYRGQALRPERRTEYQTMLDLIFKRNFSKWQDEAANDLVAAVLVIQEQQIRQTLRRWLAAELQWAEQTGYRYRPYLLEYSFGQPPDSGDPASTPQPFVLHTEAGPVRLNGRIDRVDREADGRLVIYDYKLGRGHTTSSVLELKSLQIPVYLEALEQLLGETVETVGGCYLSLKELSRTSGGIWRKVKTGLDGRSKGLLGEAEWVEWLEQMEREVATTVTAVRQGYFQLTEAKCPAYCEYRTVCRKGERKETQNNNGLSAE